MNVVTIFAGVDEGDSMPAFAEIDPFLGADFKFGHIPGCVAVGWSFDVSELDFARGFGGVNVDGEEDFEEFVSFFPVDPRVESDTGGWAEADPLFDGGFAELFGQFYGNSDRASLDDFERRASDEIDGGFMGVEFSVPGVPEGWSVIKELEEVGESPRDDEFERDFILGGDRRDITVLVEADGEVITFEFAVACFESPCGLSGVRAESGDRDCVASYGWGGKDGLFLTPEIDMLDGELPFRAV